MEHHRQLRQHHRYGIKAMCQQMQCVVMAVAVHLWVEKMAGTLWVHWVRWHECFSMFERGIEIGNFKQFRKSPSYKIRNYEDGVVLCRNLIGKYH